jgi:protein SCO1/2
MESLVKRPLLLAVGCLLAAAVTGSLLWGHAQLEARDAGKPAPPLVLPDDRGNLFDLAAHRGGAVLVTFGYAHCPDVCPETLMLLGAVWDKLGADRGEVLPVFVTLDPARDTAETLHAYLSHFDPVPTGLTGTPTEIAATARAWGVTVRPAEGGSYFDHTTLVAVVGPDGRERRRYGFSQIGNAAAVAQDVRRILHGG